MCTNLGLSDLRESLHEVFTGRKRKEWKLHDSFDLQGSESLRDAARRWLREREVLHKPLTPSSKDKRRVFLATCDECVSCSFQRCFSLDGEKKVCVEEFGSCSGARNLKRIKQANAKKFGVSAPPGKALKEMVARNVPVEERPARHQLKNQRPSLKSRKTLDYPVDCLGALEKFAREPPAGVIIHTEHMQLTDKAVRLPFECAFMEEYFADCSLTCFLLDFTFKTNKESLLLGAIGPCGLRQTNTGPHVRFVPVLFCLAEAEDEEAHGLLTRLFLQKAARHGKQYTDAFLDMACFNGAAAECERSSYKLFLHRCLQHVKTNVRQESSRRDGASGQSRLRNPELLEPILQWLEISAWLPSDAEFSTFWSHLLDRMASSHRPTDFQDTLLEFRGPPAKSMGSDLHCYLWVFQFVCVFENDRSR